LSPKPAHPAPSNPTKFVPQPADPQLMAVHEMSPHINSVPTHLEASHTRGPTKLLTSHKSTRGTTELVGLPKLMASRHSCFIQLVTHRKIGPSLLQVQVCLLKADKGRKCSRLVYFPTKNLPPPNPRGGGGLSQRVAPHKLWLHTTLGPSQVNWWPTHLVGSHMSWPKTTLGHPQIVRTVWKPPRCVGP